VLILSLSLDPLIREIHLIVLKLKLPSTFIANVVNAKTSLEVMDFEKDLSAAIIIHGKQYVSKGVRSIKFRKWFRWRREKSDLARIERLTKTAMIVSANLRASDATVHPRLMSG